MMVHDRLPVKPMFSAQAEEGGIFGGVKCFGQFSGSKEAFGWWLSLWKRRALP